MPSHLDWSRGTQLLIADVTLLKSSNVRAQLRFKGGATHTFMLPLPKSAWMLRQRQRQLLQRSIGFLMTTLKARLQISSIVRG